MASNFAIMGGWRSGKTSVLQRVRARLEKDPQCFVRYLDCQAVGTYEDFFDVLGEDEGSLDSDPANFRNMVLNLQREAGGKRIAILIDEVDAILNYDVKNGGQLFETFRSLSEERRCNFVFCGGKTLYQHINHPESPLLNFCRVITLGELDRESATEIIVHPMREKKVQIEDEVVDEIIRISSCHPNLVQYICDHLIGHISSRHVRHISLEDLRTVTARRDFYEYFVRTTWGDATPLEKMITLCMLNRRNFTKREMYTVLAQYGLQDRQAIEEALQTLELYRFFTKGKKRYHYTWSEFPRIVREVGNVEDMKKDLLGQIRQ